MLAVIRGSYEVAEFIAEESKKIALNIDSTDSLGRTALHWAALTKRYAMAELLINYGADKLITDKNGQTHFMLAPNRDIRLKEFLLAAKAALGTDGPALRRIRDSNIFHKR